MVHSATYLHQSVSGRDRAVIRRLPAWYLSSDTKLTAYATFVRLVILCCIWTGCLPMQTAIASAPVRALTIDVSERQHITRISIDMSRSVQASLFTLDRPFRLVVDFPTIDFGALERRNLRRSGLVQDYRFGPLSKNMSRLVLDIKEPFKLIDARAENPTDGRARLHLDLAPVSLASFRRQGVPPQLTPSVELRGTTESRSKQKQIKPVIVIDPGHGGPDPGASGYGRILEKRLVLKVGLALRDKLRASGRYRIVMTRDKDVFVPLDERVAIAEKAGAKLFISLHADSIAQQSLASSISGATIYTLSKRASDAKAQRVADEENAVDQLSGLPIAENAERDQIAGILFDLMQRETVVKTGHFKQYLIDSLRRRITVARSPHRSAAFRVLRQPQTPSVLIELGYMSNPKELKRMQTSGWQRSAVAAISSAIQSYFETHGN